MDLTVDTPQQQRLLDELLAWGVSRPEPDPELAGHLRALIEDGIADAVDAIPEGGWLSLNKSKLEALACDGRFLDLLDSDFAWSPDSLRGKLAHKAIEVDWRSRRVEPPDHVVAHAWDTFRNEDDGLLEFLDGLDTLTAAQLRTEAESYLTDFRDTWPLLPSLVHPRLEHPLSASFGYGKVSIRGIPDLTMGKPTRDRARMMVVDFKTGMRKPQRDRQEVRLYALLLTLKYGIAPFRWALFYVAEGAWDVEEFSVGALEAAARQVIVGVNRAARLTADPRPSEDDLRLVAGAYCRWCSREPGCETAAAANAAFALQGR